VVITGSDSGMGQAMADEFAREGADVAVRVSACPSRLLCRGDD
jgi:NAD(P)-dependent dehydrogenase (short-subunit alcohol dehydrogenase family)